jgi:predicted metalloprotease
MSISRGAKIGGLGGLGLVAVVLIGMFFGIDPSALLQGISETQTPPASTQQTGVPGVNDEMRKFVAVVLGDTEDVWSETFRKMGRTYEMPKLVLFSQAVESACGMAGSAMGPFYCPSDHKVYLDLSFFGDLRTRFGASGDFAQAYVIAHEVGHHVQNLIGVMKETQAMREQMSEVEWNSVSVQIELQADCFAGIWAHHVNSDTQMIEPGDIEEAINAASAVGDDAIQQQSQGYVRPESFTHGSSQQRMEWFNKGFKSGDPKACDTFN